MRAIIIENELHARELLKSLIGEYCSELLIIGEAKSIADSIELIDQIKPDLIFMDVELDDGKSFEILDELTYLDFYLIITTAYDQYAIKAFEYNAIDYILKPYSPKPLLKAIRKVRASKEKNDVFNNLKSLIRHNNKSSKITFSTSKGIRYCDESEILRLEASQSYCKVYLLGGETILISKPLSEVEKSLPITGFFRVHSGHTINCSYIKEISKEDGGYIVLKNDEQVPLARRRKQRLLEILSE